MDRDAMTRRIYTRILERSCATNEAFDRMFLKKSQNRPPIVGGSKSNKNTTELGDLATIANQLDHDVREILLRPEERKKMWKSQLKAEKQRVKGKEEAMGEAEKAKKEKTKQRLKVLKVKRKRNEKDEKRRVKEAKKNQKLSAEGIKPEKVDDETKQAQYNVLRIAANTRRKFRDL